MEMMWTLLVERYIHFDGENFEKQYNRGRMVVLSQRLHIEVGPAKICTVACLCFSHKLP